MGTRRFYSFSKSNQHVDYRLVNPLDALKQGAWVLGAFTPEFAQVLPHKKKLDTSFQATRFQMILWKKKEALQL